jgi:protein TonB
VRALITSNATQGSGGINTAAYSRDTGGGGLAGRATTLVEGVAGGGGGGGPGRWRRPRRAARAADGAAARAGKGGTLQKGSSGKGSRSIEDIKLVFERNKGAIYALYNRALRDDPALQGKVVLELKIAPAARCRAAHRQQRTQGRGAGEEAAGAHPLQFDFGAKDVDCG